MGELRLCPPARIYSDIQQHFAVVGRREALQCDDGVLEDDGKGNDALCVLPNAEVLDFPVLVKKSVPEKRRLEERAWEP